MAGERGFNPEREGRKRNYYEILGVPITATETEIKAAYRELARKTHPDLFPGDAAKEEEMKSINEAFEVLRDKQKRNRYDYFANVRNNPDTRSTSHAPKEEPQSEQKQEYNRDHFWGGVDSEPRADKAEATYDTADARGAWDERAAENVRSASRDAMNDVKKTGEYIKDGLKNIQTKTGRVVKQIREITGPPEKSGPERLAELREKKVASDKKKQERLEELRKKRNSKK